MLRVNPRSAAWRQLLKKFSHVWTIEVESLIHIKANHDRFLM